MVLPSAQTKRERDLANFIGKVMLNVGEEHGGLKLWIKNTGDGARREQLREYGLGPDKQADRVAMEVIHDAEEEANGSGPGIHKFVLYAFRGRETTHFLSSGFTVAADLAVDEDVKEADAKSLLGQSQRHVEAVIKQNALLTSSAIHGLTSALELSNRRLELYETNELDRQRIAHATTIDRAKLEYDQRTQDFMFKLLGQVAELAGPALVKKALEKLEITDGAPKEIEEPREERPPETVIPAALLESGAVVPIRPTTIDVTPDPIEDGSKKKRSRKAKP